MKNHNFMPLWYEELRKSKRIKILKEILAIIIFIDIALFDLFHFQSEKMKNIDEEIKKMNVNKKDTSNQNITALPKVEALKTLEKLYNYPSIYNNCIEIKIVERDVEAIVKVANYEEYYNLIKLLEENKEIKINSISSIENQTVRFSIHFI